ncbi:hypothetical protein COCSUDRAFT_54138 [Coccomyxa subellipsoidea C-169]|uniref:Uncharacterized protein n=1 Tax=Coccomyxa subellipsoidea (strain C-169) TaxID=574566 RepID=I0YRX3_COCSC|nr:hypothetical protein COCSUDRAFT_54138 [Coccomyxa subellipsoidea C-169]EIE21142.1 hypothetical protein COCSUDRAFT_54138 [Coccomyxa subellipsoidea C-169]|eukprot:XP_005645686.1 hypothetical protein COCSUDRAFT_54138 [Coccomyxa subellipsoidea C-169]
MLLQHHMLRDVMLAEEGRIRLLQQDWVDRSEELSKACDGFLRTLESLQTLSRPILQTNQQVVAQHRLSALNLRNRVLDCKQEQQAALSSAVERLHDLRNKLNRLKSIESDLVLVLKQQDQHLAGLPHSAPKG